MIELAHRNFAESMRMHARWSEHGVIDEQDGTLRTMSGTRFPAGMFNAVFPLGAIAHPAHWVEEQLRFFGAAQRGCSIYTRSPEQAEACLAAGLVSAGSAPVMVCDAPLSAPEVDIEVLPAANQAWIEVQASAYVSLGLAEKAVRELMPSPERMQGLYVLAGEAAGAMALRSDDIAGVYWVGVRPEDRKRGLGEAVTRAITNLAFEHGARAVILQASDMGYPIYKALGYREITRYPWFVAPRSLTTAR